MKNFTKKAAVAFCAVSMLLTAGCTKKTDDTPVVDASEGFVTIEFYYDSQTRGEAEYIKLIDTYNQTQGQTDKVVVIGTPVPGITNSAQSHMMRDNAPNVITVGDKSFKSLAVQNGLMLSLEDYAKDSGVTDDMPAELVNRFRFTSDTMEAGAGAELLGVPNGNAPKMFYYNAGYFKQQEINIISVSEQNLDAYNKENGTGFMPHGYAEYAAENAEVKAWADAAGLVVSTNLAGDEVYKVFNEQIPTNWEELRYLSKCFTQTYNSSSPSKFGFMTEWWCHPQKRKRDYLCTVEIAARNFLQMRMSVRAAGPKSFRNRSERRFSAPIAARKSARKRSFAHIAERERRNTGRSRPNRPMQHSLPST